jgi:serine/threonine protein kinase
MEYVDGPTLQALVEKNGPLPPKRALRYMGQIGDALAFVHSNHVVHRHIEPGTILLSTPDDRMKIADFTFARSTEFAAFGEITSTGELLAGVPYFESPEQVRDPRRADARSDIYSFGATFFFVLSGTRPIGGTNYREFLARIAVDSAPPLEKVAPGTPADISAIVNRALARDPLARFQSMAEILEALRSIAKRLG